MERIIEVASAIGSGAVVPMSIWALSRMGPLVEAWNKYLNDRHKRAKELRKDAANQRSISPTQNQNSTGLGPASVALESPPDVPFPKWWLAIVIISACIGLVDNLRSFDAATKNTVAACALYVISLVACMILALLICLMNLSLHMFKELLASNSDALEAELDSLKIMTGATHPPK